VVDVGSGRGVRRRLPYEVWHSLHLLTYVGLVLGFLHQFGGPDLTGHRPLQILWALLYTQAFALLVVYRIITPWRQANRHHLRVRSVVEKSPGVVSIEVEGRHLHELQAEAGHFFRWRFLTPANWLTAHPFSLSAPPTAQRLRLTVKALGPGAGRSRGFRWAPVSWPRGRTAP
jgi:predicted ferric reductase